jgi:hypothetical protein
MSYPTTRKRVVDTPPDWTAIDHAVADGQAANDSASNPHLYRSALWIAWNYGYQSQNAKGVSK